MFYLFSHRVTQSMIKFFSLYALKLLLNVMANAYDFAVNIVMLINYTINKALNIHDSLKKIIYTASAYDFTVNIVTVICNINKTFGIHDFLKHYSYYNVFNRENMNNFNVLTFIRSTIDTK